MTKEDTSNTEVEEAEGTKGFSNGFKKVMGEEPTSTEAGTLVINEPEDIAEDPDPEPDLDAEARVQEEAAAKQQKAMEGLPGRMSRLEGRIGSLMEQLETVVKKPATAVKDAPTQAQVAAAMKDPAAMKALADQYEDFAPMVGEIQSIRNEMAEMKSSGNIDEKLAAMETRLKSNRELEDAESAEKADLSAAYSNWEELVAKTEFTDYALDGGPSLEDYKQHLTHLNKGEDDKADRILNQWTRSFPQWWGEKGAALFSSSAEDSIKLLDGFTGKKTDAPSDKRESDADLEKERREKRLARSRTATGTDAAPSPGKTETEQFRSGFRKVMGTRINHSGSLLSS